MFDFIATLLSWLYDLWPSYGGAILLLTLIIMTVVAPFTIKQTRSMLAMQRLQPELKRIRQQHGKDRERMNQEMMALYQANGVNPLGGCLPILIQMPIFLVLFNVIRGLTRRESDIGLAMGDRILRTGIEASDFGARVFNPDFLDTSSNLYKDLSVATEMKSFGLDLSQSASQALGESLIRGLPYLLLVIGVGVTTWLQQKQIQGRATNNTMNPQQQMLMKVLPFMLPVFSFGFPAALVVYWFVSNLFRVGQQVFITRQVYGKHDAEAEIIVPESSTKKSNASTKTDDSDRNAGRAGVAGRHGSRAPVSGPPPKKRKKPPAASRPTTSGSASGSRTRDERAGSRRVTPKKGTEAPPAAPERRRDRKKK